MDNDELARKVSDLERRVSDLDYDLRKAIDDLHGEIARKADKYHDHEGGQQ